MTSGRKAKPTQLKLIEGTLRKDRLNKNEPKFSKNLAKCPRKFNQAQTEAWDYAIANAPKGLLKSMDFSTLQIWVTALVTYEEAMEKVFELGQVTQAPSGFLMSSPYLTNANKQAQLLLRAASDLGFTPASRSRINVEDDPGETNDFAMFAVAE
jgi:P27 family predicted phage terminase small subunit